MDMGGAYRKATNNNAPQARQCVDPFHVIKPANEAVDKARLWAWNRERQPHPPVSRRRGRRPKNAPAETKRPRCIKHTRWALVKDPDGLTDQRRWLDAQPTAAT